MPVITGPGQQVPFQEQLYPTKQGMGNKIPSGYKLGRLQQFTPEQMELFQGMFGQLGPESYLGKLAAGDEGTFNQMEAPALRQFQGVLGGIGSKFSGMGMGARRSSGFQQATTAAGSNFAQELQANRTNMQRQAMQDLMNYSQQLLGQRPYENLLVQKEQKPNAMSGAVSGAASGAGVGSMFGPWGALAGGVIGGAAGYFGSK